MTYYVLHYDLRDDYFEARGQYRAEHLELATAATKRGDLRLAGAHEDVADGATLVFDVADPSVVEEFAAGDPYVKAGIVTSWRVIPWTVVNGADYKG